MSSTWEDVLQKAYDAINGVGFSALGFASAVNVKNYLPEHTATLKLKSYYLAALATGKQGVRVWAVDVKRSLLVNRYSPGLHTLRIRLRTVGWYDIGVDGAGKLLLG